MQFTVLGSGTAVPDATRGPAGFLLQVDGDAILIDGGSGTLGRLAALGITPAQLTAGVYSHRHLDHTGDLAPLLFAMRLPPARLHPYPLFAGEGFRSFFADLETAYKHWVQPAGGVPIHELPLDGPGRADIGPVSLHTRPANHKAGALHLRFEVQGHSLVFSGDTGPSDALVELATGADLLVVECAGADAAPIPGHLTPSDVAAVLRAARPRQAWVTHFYPTADVDLAMSTITASGVAVRRASDGDAWSP